MVFQIFCIHDSKAAAYHAPFFLPTRAMAVRAFADQANDETSTIQKHPEDYTLFHLGGYDDNTAEIALLTTPMAINKANQLVRQDLQPLMKAAE